MAARATRSACRAARHTSAVATGPLGALSHDELGVIFDGLADPLQPVVAVALSSTCLGLRTPLGTALEVLKERHARAVALCRKASTFHQYTSCAKLRDAEKLSWAAGEIYVKGGFTADHMATFGMILQTNRLVRLKSLELGRSRIDDAGVCALCEGLDHRSAPSLRLLGLGGSNFGPPGTAALAAALRRGAMPRLQVLGLHNTRIGNQGATELAAPLRSLPALENLFMDFCGIGDEGVASLFADLGKDDFKALEYLSLIYNNITDVGMAKLLSAVNSGAAPHLKELPAEYNDAKEESVSALSAALELRRAAQE